MKHLLSRLAGLLAFALLAFGPAGAQTLPILDMEVVPSALTGNPDDTLTWALLLINNTDATAHFRVTGFNDGLAATPDVQVNLTDFGPFFTDYTLEPGEGVNFSNFFETVIASAPENPGAVYDSTAELTYDLYEDAGFAEVLSENVVSSGDWTLTVAAPVPGPGALWVLAVGLAPLARAAGRRAHPAR